MADLSHEQQDAFDRMRQVLQQYGLNTPELFDWLRQAVVDGTTESSMMLDLYDPNTVPGKVVNTLYPELKARRDANLAPLSIAAAVEYRDKAVQIFRSAGIPKGFYDDPQELAKFSSMDVSLAELQDRVNERAALAQQAPAETRAQLQALYGIDQGHLTAYWLDPTKALPLLHKQAEAARISGVGVRTGFGGLSRGEAERLAVLGVSDQQATQGFGALVQNRELFSVLPGQEQQDGGISRQQQLAAVFGGDASALSAIERKRRAQQAVFGSRGGLAATQTGIGGLSSAAS